MSWLKISEEPFLFVEGRVYHLGNHLSSDCSIHFNAFIPRQARKIFLNVTIADRLDRSLPRINIKKETIEIRPLAGPM